MDGGNKPVFRSVFRLRTGALFFTVKRYAFWVSGGLKFARRSENKLSYTVFKHSTPLIRQLKNVDMYLQYNKIVNLKIAAKKLDGLTLKPGETFSYWKTAGRPSKRKGYLNGMILRNGSVAAGIGGGLCQMSNLIYWMTIHTPLTVTERHRHEYDVFPDSDRVLPFGSGATCFYNYGDLMIRNDTGCVFQLRVKVTENDLAGEWRSDKPQKYRFEVYQKEHIIKHEIWGGYTRYNALFRKKYDIFGNCVDDEYVVENHAVMMYSPLIDGVK